MNMFGVSAATDQDTSELEVRKSARKRKANKLLEDYVTSKSEPLSTNQQVSLDKPQNLRFIQIRNTTIHHRPSLG